jgi:hypothetical protein
MPPNCAVHRGRNSLRSLRPVIAALYRPLVYTPSDFTSLLE